MTVNGWMQIIVFALVLLAVTKPVGLYLVRSTTGRSAG